VRISPKGQVCQVGECHTPALAIDFPIRGITPDHLGDFDIEQMRRVECLTRGEQATFHAFRCWRAEKDFKQSRGVDDDHARSRPARTASAGATEGAVSVRLCNRARNSSSVGRSAT